MTKSEAIARCRQILDAAKRQRRPLTEAEETTFAACKRAISAANGYAALLDGFDEATNDDDSRTDHNAAPTPVDCFDDELPGLIDLKFGRGSYRRLQDLGHHAHDMRQTLSHRHDPERLHPTSFGSDRCCDACALRRCARGLPGCDCEDCRRRGVSQWSPARNGMAC